MLALPVVRWILCQSRTPCQHFGSRRRTLFFHCCWWQSCNFHDHDLLSLVSFFRKLVFGSCDTDCYPSWSFGLNGIPWIVSAEIFPGALRNITGTYAALVQW